MRGGGIATALGGLAGSCLFLASAGVAAQTPAGDLTALSLEELMSIEVTVTTAARHPQRLGDTGAAMFVLTGEEIHRSGATTIPDALRLVPGVQVARIDANKWAVTARGFNGRFANKLLVMIDGRTVYTPLFSGVLWEREGVFLDDIDRIEVIRGPGASLWGANAVNGVINIITKPASRTQGGLALVSAGTEERGGAGVRYGGKIGETGHYRVYGEGAARDAGGLPGNDGANDRGWHERAGFRTDLSLGLRDALTIQGDLFQGSDNETTLRPVLTPPFTQPVDQASRGIYGNLLGRWTRRLSEASHIGVQAYYQHVTSRSFQGGDTEDMLDAEMEHRFAPGNRHDVLWGFGIRGFRSDLRGSAIISASPKIRTEHLVNLFAQDEVTLVPSTLKMTVGAKVEHNDYTGFEVQPSARLTWMPHPDSMVWAAASRAVRTPSRTDEDFSLLAQVMPGPGGLPVAVRLTGDHAFVSETLRAYELGARVQPDRSLSLDVAAFYNVYSNLRSFESGTPTLSFDPVPHLEMPVMVRNLLDARTFGFELSAEWEARPGWRLRGAYSLLKMHATPGDGSTDTRSPNVTGGSPTGQLVVRSSHDLTSSLNLDITVRAVDRLPALNVPGYVGLDVRVAWRPDESWELALVGQNLLHKDHAEFQPDLIDTRPSLVQRGVYAKLTRRF